MYMLLGQLLCPSRFKTKIPHISVYDKLTVRVVNETYRSGFYLHPEYVIVKPRWRQ